jgi:8-oxo-dGTP pyrophosphatase MutT (NUDIX family)
VGVPAGTWSAGRSGTRDELAAAELREETGLTAGRTTHLGHLFLAYGISSQGYDVHLAHDLTAGEPDRDATEQDMRHAFFSEDEFVAMVAAARSSTAARSRRTRSCSSTVGGTRVSPATPEGDRAHGVQRG